MSFNTGVSSHSLLQGIFLIQGLNLCLLHCRNILYQSDPSGKPFNTCLDPITVFTIRTVSLFSKFPCAASDNHTFP